MPHLSIRVLMQARHAATVYSDHMKRDASDITEVVVVFTRVNRRCCSVFFGSAGHNELRTDHTREASEW